MTDLLLQRGKLEKTCRECGRWEAASPRCSWCHARIEPSDYYLNHDLAERHARIPDVAPENPPSEYRSVRGWPEKWGESPYRKAAPEPRTAVSAANNTSLDADGTRNDAGTLGLVG